VASSADVRKRRVFSVAGYDYRWEDVVRAAQRWSRWEEVTRAASAGVAALGAMTEPFGNDELRAAARSFRYEHRLLAAEELEGWLEHWGLTTRQWVDYLRRTLARSEAATGANPPPADETIWAQAVCSGALVRAARDLATRAAAAAALGRTAGSVDTELARMDEALVAFEQEAQSPDAQARTLRLRAADWVRVRFSTLELPTAATAREAALCLREDGLSLTEVAARAGVGVDKRDALIEELDPELAKALLGAAPDELLGPVGVADGFALLSVREKIAPALGDPVIQERLEREVLRRALEREVRNRVRWHERL
jgi:hypothetical protein